MVSEPIKGPNLSIAPMLVSLRRDYSATDTDGSDFAPQQGSSVTGLPRHFQRGNAK
jgi:hypothetical protein